MNCRLDTIYDVECSIGVGKIDEIEEAFCDRCGKMARGQSECKNCGNTSLNIMRLYKEHVTGRMLYAERVC